MNATRWLAASAAGMLGFAAGSVPPVCLAQGAPMKQAAPKFMIGTDMMMPNFYLINTESDKLVKLDLSKDPKWPGGLPLHTIITADGRKAYLSVMSSDKDPHDSGVANQQN